MSKKLITILLSLMIMFAFGPCSAFAANTELGSAGNGSAEGADSNKDVNQLTASEESQKIKTVAAFDSKELYSFIYDGRTIYKFYFESDINDDDFDEDDYEGQGDLTYSLKDSEGDVVCYENSGDGNSAFIIADNGAANDLGYSGYDCGVLQEGDIYHLYVENDSEYSYESRINIITGTSYARSLTFSNTEYHAESMERIQYANVQPQGGVVFALDWTSDDPDVAVAWDEYIYGETKGTCKLSCKLITGTVCTMNVTISDPLPYIKWYEYYTYRGGKFTNKIMYATGPVTWKSSNKKIATVSSTGKVTGKKIGKCYIYGTCEDVTYKCRVIVERLDPNFAAEMYSYSNKNKWIKLCFKNIGKKSLTIYSSKAKYIDCDFTSCNRNLKIGGHSKVIVKPGKTKYIKFKIKKGRFTWKPWGSRVIYYFKYDGLKFKGRAFDYFSDSDYHRSSGYYYTYWTDAPWADDEDDDDDDDDDDWDYDDDDDWDD